MPVALLINNIVYSTIYMYVHTYVHVYIWQYEYSGPNKNYFVAHN